jgi:hypothetical protein
MHEWSFTPSFRALSVEHVVSALAHAVDVRLLEGLFRL